MDMVPVTSSNIEAIGYDAPAKELHVHFKGGGKYKYLDVSPAKHAAFMKTASHGKHFAAKIRNAHKFEKY